MSSTEELLVRPAAAGDAPALARVHLDARRAAVPAMPPSVHSAAETCRWVHDWVDASVRGIGEVWVAEERGRVVGYARLTQDWLDDLYVEPRSAGRGVGGVLLELVKARRPGGFELWVFESNHPARRFYRRHGLVEVERTDGSGNEERAPDVRMSWPGTSADHRVGVR